MVLGVQWVTQYTGYMVYMATPYQTVSDVLDPLDLNDWAIPSRLTVPLLFVPKLLLILLKKLLHQPIGTYLLSHQLNGNKVAHL